MVAFAKPIVRCSGLDQLIYCPGSRRLIPLVKERSGPESWEGSWGHFLIADRAIRQLGATPPPGGLEAPDVPEDYEFPRGSDWLVKWSYSHLRYNTSNDWSLEVEVPLAYEFERLILSGHIDALSVSPDLQEAIITDWKLGYTAVDIAEANWQLMGYIVLLKRAYPTLKKITAKICQPRANQEAGEQRVSEVTVGEEAIEACVGHLEKEINAAIARENEVESGIKQCRWCPVGIQCPAIQGDLKLMKAMLTQEVINTMRAEAPDTLLADIVLLQKTVEKATDDAKEILKDRINQKKRIVSSSGIAITSKFEGGRYEVTDPVAFYARLRGLLPENRIANSVSYSVAKIKAAISDELHIPESGHAAINAESIFEAKFGDLVKQGSRQVLCYT